MLDGLRTLLVFFKIYIWVNYSFNAGKNFHKSLYRLQVNVRRVEIAPASLKGDLLYASYSHLDG